MRVRSGVSFPLKLRLVGMDVRLSLCPHLLILRFLQDLSESLHSSTLLHLASLPSLRIALWSISMTMERLLLLGLASHRLAFLHLSHSDYSPLLMFAVFRLPSLRLLSDP